MHLRHTKSFVSRAACKVPHCQKWDCHATAFRFGQSHSEAVFNFYFNSRRDQKRARQIHTLERVATLFLGLRHDAQNASSCFKSSPEIMRLQSLKDDTNIHVLNWGGPPLGVQNLYTFPTQKPASNKSNNLICRPDSVRKRKMRKMLRKADSLRNLLGSASRTSSLTH